VLAERRQQGQQMTLGAADAADPVDVDDSHDSTCVPGTTCEPD
jgi:hypothetical protein